MKARADGDRRPARFSRPGAALMMLALLACSSSSGAPDAGNWEVFDAAADVAVDSGAAPSEAGLDARVDGLACNPPPPNYPICPPHPCLTGDEPGCNEVCLLGSCYDCRPDGTWQRSIVDCVRGDAGASPDGSAGAPPACDGIGAAGQTIAAVVEAVGSASAPGPGPSSCEGDIPYGIHVVRTLCGAAPPDDRVIANYFPPSDTTPLLVGEHALLVLVPHGCPRYDAGAVLEVIARHPLADWDDLAAKLRRPDGGP